MADNDNHHDGAETPQPEQPSTQQGQEQDSARGAAQNAGAEQSAAKPGGDAAAKPGAQSDEQPAERAESHADDGAETADDDEAPQPRGLGIRLRELSGPQACLSIVGCGTLAAVLVVGLVFGGIRLVANSFTPDEESDAVAAPTREPRETYDTDAISRVCELLESQGRIGAGSNGRIDSGENFIHGDDEGRAFVEDECVWEVPSDSGDTWRIVFSYHAYVEPGSDQTMSEASQAEYQARLDDSTATVDGDVHDAGLGEESGYVYAADGSETGRAAFNLLTRSENLVIDLKLDDVTRSGEAFGETATSQEFLAASRDTVDHMQGVLDNLLPDEPA